jgi:hypothetical protein
LTGSHSFASEQNLRLFTGLASVLAGAHGKQAWFSTNLPSIVALFTFIATIVSALNSAMRPILQYSHYVRYINKFWTQKTFLDLDLDTVVLA